MVFARFALLLTGGAAVKLAFTLQDEDDVQTFADTGVVPRKLVDRRLGGIRRMGSRDVRGVCDVTETAVGLGIKTQTTEPTDGQVLTLTPPITEANTLPEGTAEGYENQGDVVTPGKGANDGIDENASDTTTTRTAPRPPPTVHRVTFAATPEPSPFDASQGDSSDASIDSFITQMRRSLDEYSASPSNNSEGDRIDDSDDSDTSTVSEDAAAIAQEYLSTLPFVPPPGAEPPVTPGAGLKKPTVCASPFIAANGLGRRIVRGEGGKGNFVKRAPNGGAVKRPLIVQQVADENEPKDSNETNENNPNAFQTPGRPKTSTTKFSFPKTPGPVFPAEDDEEENFEDEDDTVNDENSPIVKLHVSLNDLRCRTSQSVDDSRERYAQDDAETNEPPTLKQVDVNTVGSRY